MSAENFIKMLAVAFNAKQLYPDPSNIPAFTQAVEKLGELGGLGLIVEVTVEGFCVGSEPIEVEHRAAGRLGQLLFANRVESVGLRAAPTPAEVVEFFDELEIGGDGDGLDVATRVDLAGVSALTLRMREVLEDRQDEEDEHATDRHPDVDALLASNGVQRIADRINSSLTVTDATDDYFSLYLSAYSQLGDDDPAGLERVVQTFVDAFFRLEQVFQVAVFEAAMARRKELPVQQFLDQFSGDEFRALAAQVEDSVLPLLLDYAAAAAEHVGEAADSSGAGGGGEVDSSRRPVATSVGQHLADFLEFDSPHSQAMANISAEIEQLAEDPFEGSKLFAELLLVEGRQERFVRLLRVWAGRSTRAIHQRSFDLALSWLEALASRTDLDPRLVDEAYRQVVTDEVFDILTGEDSPGRAELLEALSARASTRILDALAVEEEPGRRRVLVEVVAEIARVDMRSVVEGLSDPRWYVVRNLATALGRSGRRAAAQPLSRLMDHDDHRVRIEAARALLPCLGDDAVDYLLGALADEHTRVRATVSDLLRTFPDDVAVPALESGVRDQTLSVGSRVAMIEALGARGGAGAQTILSEVAGSKAGFSSSARAIRSAARAALRSSNA